MTDIERSIDIDAPVEKVFQYAADWQNWPKFFEGVSDFAPTTETTRGTGARYAYKAEMLGMKTAVETEIRNFVENEGWTGVATKGTANLVVCQVSIAPNTMWMMSWRFLSASLRAVRFSLDTR